MALNLPEANISVGHQKVLHLESSSQNFKYLGQTQTTSSFCWCVKDEKSFSTLCCNEAITFFLVAPTAANLITWFEMK
jgi:hypothetical protein